jgi:hypothetical protein
MTNFRGLLFIASVVAATVTFATWAIFRHWGPSWYSDWEVITLGSVYNICFLIVSTALVKAERNSFLAPRLQLTESRERWRGEATLIGLLTFVFVELIFGTVVSLATS